jgi:predicted RNA-binding Zn ribbon-like protein
MLAHPMRTRLKAAGDAVSTELWFDPRQPEDLFAPLANSTAALFAHADRNRVRKCAQCVLHFHDTSKKGTRRWCSMQLCGNRIKVAAYAARQEHGRQKMISNIDEPA